MRAWRMGIVVFGILLPYAARIPRGSAWLHQYTDLGIGGHLLFGAFNALAWGSLLAISRLFRRVLPLSIPCVAGFGFLAWGHYHLDLASDAQAAIGFVLFPVYALAPIAIGAVIGLALDRGMR